MIASKFLFCPHVYMNDPVCIVEHAGQINSVEALVFALLSHSASPSVGGICVCLKLLSGYYQ